MTSNTDERLKKELGVGRQSREMEDRKVVENREVTDDDRLEMFRAQLFNDALPDLPHMPGYHMCWLTTTNPRDPIHRRIQLGYEPIKASDVPGMEFASVKTGEWAGLIGVNEMIAFRLPETLYQRFMQEAHHDAPLREENKLAETAEIMRQQAEGSGSTLFEGDGLMEMRDNNSRIGLFD
jgi:hypothetical protein